MATQCMRSARPRADVEAELQETKAPEPQLTSEAEEAKDEEAKDEEAKDTEANEEEGKDSGEEKEAEAKEGEAEEADGKDADGDGAEEEAVPVPPAPRDFLSVIAGTVHSVRPAHGRSKEGEGDDAADATAADADAQVEAQRRTAHWLHLPRPMRTLS